MDDVRRELAALRRRVRLQAMASVGALCVLCFAMGGADATARALVDVDAWTIKTKDAGGTLTTRLTCTTDVATAKIKVQNANLHLAPQSSLPSGMDAGALGYDSTASQLKFFNGAAWTSPGAPAFREVGVLYSPTSAVTWTNQPSADTELYGTTNGPYSRKKLDLSGFSQFRLTATLTAGGSSGAKLRVRYSTDQSTWLNLEDTTTTADLDIVTTGNAKVGTLGNIVAAAKADVFLQIIGTGASTNTGDPSFRMIAIQFK